MHAPRDLDTAPDEPFELLERLGAGGFAVTYKARVLDEYLREEFGTDEVALKIPLDKKKERVLKREFELNAALHLRLKGLKSLNIVRYLGFAFFDRRFVMAMEYVGQGSLRRVLGDVGRQKRLPVPEAVAMAEGVLNGLTVIHNEHIFHRDIKPENILLEGRTPKIADLGIARILDSNELASTTTGTIYYMSPEILSEEGASFTSDIWSLGVTLYEMVTGRLPFGGPGTALGTMADLIRRVNPTPAREVCPDLPTGLSEIISKSLQKRPSDRYASAEEMCEALRKIRQKAESHVDEELAAIRGAMSGVDQADEVEKKLRSLAVKYPREPKVYQHLGEFYNRCERYTDAISAFQSGLKITPDHALLHWDLALAYQRIGKGAEAARNLERAMSLGLDASLQRHAASLLKVLRGGRG